jgi:hypothetical protein
VLLLGALEETHVITAPMVDDTAEELRRDLGDGQVAPASPLVPAEDLTPRIEALERLAARQDRISRRILDLLEAGAASKTAGAPA